MTTGDPVSSTTEPHPVFIQSRTAQQAMLLLLLLLPLDCYTGSMMPVHRHNNSISHVTDHKPSVQRGCKNTITCLGNKDDVVHGGRVLVQEDGGNVE